MAYDLKRFQAFLFWTHRLQLKDLEVADSPGYWRVKAPCVGCASPTHSPLFPSGSKIHHTVYFEDPSESKGHFRKRSNVERFATWMYCGGVIK